ncbi:MAG: phosphohydrolase, partial [Deltaproteobacteria bacterium]|nr:phosphohydrolase [Deltaproteobacteria bacterium]
MNDNSAYTDFGNVNDAPLFNSKLTKTYIEYLNKNHPEIDTNTLLEHAGMTMYQLDDEGHWFTQNQISRFHDKLLEQTKDTDIARKVGQYAALSKSSTLVKQFARGFINPASAYRWVGKTYSHMCRYGTLETRNLGSDRMELTFKPTPGVDEKPSQCKNRWGTFESLGKLFTNNLANIEHPVCLHQGG